MHTLVVQLFSLFNVSSLHQGVFFWDDIFEKGLGYLMFSLTATIYAEGLSPSCSGKKKMVTNFKSTHSNLFFFFFVFFTHTPPKV